MTATFDQQFEHLLQQMSGIYINPLIGMEWKNTI